jgi:hypothetical protein
MNRLLMTVTIVALSGFFLLNDTGSAVAGEEGAAGIVSSIEKAPVIADGDVSGQPTDFVITLTGSPDQDIPGRTLMAGKEIRVIFPPEFDLGSINPAYPLRDVPWPLPPVPPLPPAPCVPANLQCTTAVMLQGWPQHPPFPPALFHTLSIDLADNAFVFTALQDISPNPPSSPGIKQLHLILNGVTNPEPGEYLIRVEAQTGPSGAWETGSGILKIVPKPRPSVNVTSVFVKALAGLLPGGQACGPGTNPPNPDNPVFQTTAVGDAAPFMWSLLLWDKKKGPMDDVDLAWVNDHHAQLKRGKKTVGHVYIDAPPGADGHDIEVNPLDCPTRLPGAPVIAGTPGIGPQPVGRLDLLFWTGSKPGLYTTTISLNNGNSVQLFVTAE